MSRAFPTIVISAIIFTLLSCGKPSATRDPKDMVEIFTEQLNLALKSAEYTKLIDLFAKDGKVILQTEFNPEVHVNHQGIRNYFGGIALDTKFEVSNIRESGLQATAQYSYLQKNGVSGSGMWTFNINNMGKIKELSIVPGF